MRRQDVIRVQNLLEAIRRLAAPADSKVKYLIDLGVYPYLDELAIVFDDFFKAMIHVRDSSPQWAKVVESCKKVDNALQYESNGWHVEGLHSPEWIRIQELSVDALAEIEKFIAEQ